MKTVGEGMNKDLEMRDLINELRENIRQSGNPVSRQLLDELDNAAGEKTVSGANQIFKQVDAQHRQYMRGNT